MAPIKNQIKIFKILPKPLNTGIRQSAEVHFPKNKLGIKMPNVKIVGIEISSNNKKNNKKIVLGGKGFCFPSMLGPYY